MIIQEQITDWDGTSTFVDDTTATWTATGTETSDYGTFSIGTDGTWTYSFKTTDAAKTAIE